MPQLSKETRTRLIRILSIISLITCIFVVFGLAFLAAGLILAASSGYAEELAATLAEALEVSMESAVLHVMLGMGLTFISGILGIIRGVRGIRSKKRPELLRGFAILSEAILAIDGVTVVWNAAMGGYGDAGTVASALFGILFNAFMTWLGLYAAREDGEVDPKEIEVRRLAKERKKLGLIRLIQFSYALNIIFSFTHLLFITRDQMTYGYVTVVDWINLTMNVVCFWMIWKRLKMARNGVITLSVINIILNSIQYIFLTPSVGALIGTVLIDVLVILYFVFSKRPKEAFVNEMSHERRIDTEGGDLIAKKGWPRWRNLLLYYCVFSVLGHWMELGFCMLIRAGLVAGEYDPTNTMLWRDLLFPFPMEGIAVVICALWLYPFKNWLIEKIRKPFIPLLISFLVNGLLCSVIEFVGGLLANPNHELWDYSNMPFNIMGQVCLQNAIGFGLACTLITWVVYPALERAIARIPNDIMNVIFVGAFSFNMILQVLYLVEPAEIANAFNRLGAMVSGNAPATSALIPLLPWLPW